MSRARIAVIVIVLAALGAVAWFLRPDRQYQPSTPAEKTLVSVMMSDLTGLRRAEFDYFKMNSHYTSVADSTIFLRTPGVSAPTITVDRSGWYATVTHDRLPGVICTIAVGTTNPLQPHAREGDAVCTKS